MCRFPWCRFPSHKVRSTLSRPKVVLGAPLNQGAPSSFPLVNALAHSPALSQTVYLPEDEGFFMHRLQMDIWLRTGADVFRLYSGVCSLQTSYLTAL